MIGNITKGGSDMKRGKARTTADRLDRFKKADHWTQRRVEEGFAIRASCIAENRRAIKGARWHDLKKHVFRGVTFYSQTVNPFTPENIKKEFEYQRIDGHLYHKAANYLRMIEQEALSRGRMTDDLYLCCVMLNSVIAKVPCHLRK